MNKNTIIEGVGFFFEAICFFLSGFMLLISYRIAILLYIAGLILAIVVGKLIKKNAIINKIELVPIENKFNYLNSLVQTLKN